MRLKGSKVPVFFCRPVLGLLAWSAACQQLIGASCCIELPPTKVRVQAGYSGGHGWPCVHRTPGLPGRPLRRPDNRHHSGDFCCHARVVVLPVSLRTLTELAFVHNVPERCMALSYQTTLNGLQTPHSMPLKFVMKHRCTAQIMLAGVLCEADSSAHGRCPAWQCRAGTSSSM